MELQFKGIINSKQSGIFIPYKIIKSKDISVFIAGAKPLENLT
jgi:hypothetical protein